MEEFIVEYLGEFIIAVVSFLCGLFGRKDTAKKLIKFRRKMRAKQEKKVQKEAKKLEEDLKVLKEI